jgi:hypothetical protein
MAQRIDSGTDAMRQLAILNRIASSAIARTGNQDAGG